MFLGVLKVKVIDVEADPSAEPPVVEVSHLEVAKYFLEDAPAQVAINLEGPQAAMFDYYEVQSNGAQLQTIIHPVTVKGGPRAAGKVFEIVEIVANGQGVGSAEVEV